MTYPSCRVSLLFTVLLSAVALACVGEPEPSGQAPGPDAGSGGGTRGADGGGSSDAGGDEGDGGDGDGDEDGDGDGGGDGDEDGGDGGDGDGDEDGDGGDGGDDGDGDACQAGDGIIHRDEYPVNVGASAPYTFGLDVPVDSSGEVVDGVRTWDLSEIRDEYDEYVRDVVLHDPDDYWFGDEFPEATYASALSEEEDELGIFRATDEAVYMIGVASPDDGYYRTELEYDPPILMLDFPLEEGKTWSTESTASGSYGGNHFHAHSESYTMQVDAEGHVYTPYSDAPFPVLRLQTELEQEVFFLGSDLRSLTFISDCVGPVARMVSEDGESDVEFDHAAQVMRIGP